KKSENIKKEVDWKYVEGLFEHVYHIIEDTKNPKLGYNNEKERKAWIKNKLHLSINNDFKSSTKVRHKQ
ncbi:5307_t:CDS:1, partial [Cetraspora pellucida]